MVLTSSTHSLKGKAWWEKLSLGYWLTLKYSNQLQSEAAFSKGTWSFAVERFWNCNETCIHYYYNHKFGILIHFLSQPFQVGCKYSILYCNALKTPWKNSLLFIYSPVGWRGRFSWNPCTVVGNILWFRPWKKYLGLTTVFCLIRILCSMKLGL